jgi:adenylate cyclase
MRAFPVSTTMAIRANCSTVQRTFHRVVTRMDDDRRRSDPAIPSTANWHSSYIGNFAGSSRRIRHRTFFDTWPHVVGYSDVETIIDIRTLPGYQAAKEA